MNFRSAFAKPADLAGFAAIFAATFLPLPASAAEKPAVSARHAPAPGGQLPGAALRRFALVAGANDGGQSRVRLRYAGTDAANFAGVLTELGGVAAGDLKVLREPTRREFIEAMGDLRKRVAAANAAGDRAELLVYFSGHSDETGLMLGGECLAYPEFRARIDSIPARIRLAVVDACASGALTRLKGGSRLPAFSVDQSSNLSGYAFLTSSSGAESAQESDRIRASFFTHYLVTGLRGAADRNSDGRVTLGEAYAFAFQETLSQTEGSQAGAQHPSYDMRLTGTGDLVLTDLRGTSAGLVLPAAIRGRLFVRGASGDLVAELQKQPGVRVELGLEPGLYDVSLDHGDSLFRALVKVDTASHQPMAMADFAPVARERTRRRGDEPPSANPDSAMAQRITKVATAAIIPSDEGWLPARLAVVPGLGFPGRGPGPWSHNVSVNLFSGHARVIRGLQFSLGKNTADEEMSGMQLGAFNFSGTWSEGLQVGLLANRSSDDLKGIQVALFANSAATETGAQIACVNHADVGTGLQAGLLNAAGHETGVQAGLLNAAKRQSGMQAGLINTAGTQNGLQAGIMNFADTARGAQIGIINYATHSEGAVIGLVNIILNGMHDVETTFDDRSMLRTAFLLGGPYNYNYIEFDMKARYPRHLWGGSAGIGVHMPGKLVFSDIDAGAGLVLNEKYWENYSVTGRARFIAGIRPMRWFSIFGGATFNIEAWPATFRSNLNPEHDGDRLGSDIREKMWPGFVMGVRI